MLQLLSPGDLLLLKNTMFGVKISMYNEPSWISDDIILTSSNYAIVLNSTHDWIYVFSNNRVGWVHMSHLSKLFTT